MNDDLEAMAATLEHSGRYRVLRRLVPRARTDDAGSAPTRNGLFLDLETTGLDAGSDEVIEIAAVPFAFTADGRIVDVGPAFDRLRQPSIPIPPKITTLTGITQAMVAGHTIDPGEIAAVVEPADLVLAHNARFDRPFAERLHPAFADKPWACSMTQALWDAHGFEGVKLKYLLTSAGLFHEGHRALDDCHAALELLSRPLGDSGRTALAHVLEAAAKTTVRIWAVGAPYDMKDLLRSRVYRWNPGGDGRPRAWYLDVGEDEAEAEIAFLRAGVFRSDWNPTTTRITARERFSSRL